MLRLQSRKAAYGSKENAMSWKPEVIADSFGKWAGNACRFATREEAEQYVYDLALRWLAVRDTRVVESADAVNYAIVDNAMVAVKADA